jgi:hypothetical protein
MGSIAFTFADRLKDWVCEPIAWGEQQIAFYLIPVRRLPTRARRSPIRAMRDRHRGNTGRLPAALEQWVPSAATS